jgi:hypothetical protein
VDTPLRTVVKRSRLAALVLALAVVPATAGPADAASKHHRAKAKHAVAKKKTVTAKRAAAKPAAPAATPAPAPAPAVTPAVNSVISIGGYVFFNLTYAEAVDAYAAAVAAAPAGYTPPPVTSVSATTTVGTG